MYKSKKYLRRFNSFSLYNYISLTLRSEPLTQRPLVQNFREIHGHYNDEFGFIPHECE